MSQSFHSSYEMEPVLHGLGIYRQTCTIPTQHFATVHRTLSVIIYIVSCSLPVVRTMSNLVRLNYEQYERGALRLRLDVSGSYSEIYLEVW